MVMLSQGVVCGFGNGTFFILQVMKVLDITVQCFKTVFNVFAKEAILMLKRVWNGLSGMSFRRVHLKESRVLV